MQNFGVSQGSPLRSNQRLSPNSSPTNIDGFGGKGGGASEDNNNNYYNPRPKSAQEGKKTNSQIGMFNNGPRANTANSGKRGGNKKSNFKSRSTTNNQSKNSNQNWIPDEIRQKMVRRDLLVAQSNFAGTKKIVETRNQEKNRHKLNPLDTCKSHERFGLERRGPCGLCCQTFLPINLVLAVPLKAVLDIRDSWGEKFDPKGSSKVRLNKNMRRAPLCYDEVKVCVFCSQLFAQQQDLYRPSWESKEAEKMRVREAAEAKQRKAFWDPLTTTEMERATEMKEMKDILDRGEE